MPVLNRKAALSKLPQMKCVPFPVPELGGDVLLRSLRLTDRLNLALDRGSMVYIARVLADCVLDDQKNPLFSADEWDEFGAQFSDRAMEIWKKVVDISKVEEPEPPKEGEQPKNA